MVTMTNKTNEINNLERAMAEFFRTENLEDIQWVDDSREQKEHGLYLVAMWSGMSKLQAMRWINNEI